MKSKLHGKRERQLRSIERDTVQLASYEQALAEDKDNKILKKKIERVKIVIENTKKRLV
jgi:anti-sigma28 factor (negative regulator of flagellin synthesis)